MTKLTAEQFIALRTEFDPEKLLIEMRAGGHGDAVGMNYEKHGEDWIELSLAWREELVGVASSGILASGAIVSLIDSAAGLAVWIARGQYRPSATLDLRIDYLKAAPKGATVFARCQCYKLTRLVAFVRGTAHLGDIDRPIAKSALTFMTTA